MMAKVIGMCRKQHYCFVREKVYREYFTVEAVTENEALKMLESTETPMRACVISEQVSVTDFKRFKAGE